MRLRPLSQVWATFTLSLWDPAHTSVRASCSLHIVGDPEFCVNLAAITCAATAGHLFWHVLAM